MIIKKIYEYVGGALSQYSLRLPCYLLLINCAMCVPKAELHHGAHLSELCGLDTAEAGDGEGLRTELCVRVH